MASGWVVSQGNGIGCEWGWVLAGRRWGIRLVTCLCDSSRCFMRTATTTLTRTNWAIRTKMTKKMGAMIRETQQFLIQSAEASHFSRSVSFMIPFQLSPVATRNSVKKAMPKLEKCACSPRPWHGCSSSHSASEKYKQFMRYPSCAH